MCQLNPPPATSDPLILIVDSDFLIAMDMQERQQFCLSKCVYISEGVQGQAKIKKRNSHLVKICDNVKRNLFNPSISGKRGSVRSSLMGVDRELVLIISCFCGRIPNQQASSIPVVLLTGEDENNAIPLTARNDFNLVTETIGGRWRIISLQTGIDTFKRLNQGGNLPFRI